MVQGNLTLPRCGLKVGLGHASGNPFQNQRKSPIKASQEESIWTIETEQDRSKRSVQRLSGANAVNETVGSALD